MEKNTLRIRFLGAIGTVTGSCTLIEYICSEDNKKQYFLVDAGSFQNESNVNQDNKRREILAHIARDIKIIFITHAHLDHIGILPDIIKYGFRGKICCTRATHELLTAMLTYGEGNENNANLLKKVTFFDIDGRHNEKQNTGFGKTYFNITSNLRYGILRTSHVLGSCAIYFQWTEENYPADCTVQEKEWKILYFTGDIGPSSDTVAPNILFKGHQTPYWDKYDKCIIIESTYGEKIREKDNLLQRKIDKLSEIIDKTIEKNGIVIIPAFALDRAQQILIDLFYIFKNKEEKNKLSDENLGDWKYVLKYLFDETMIKNIISTNKIKALQGNDKKQLRRKITKEIEQICQKLETRSDTKFKDSNDDCQNLIADIFTRNNVEKPNLNDDSIIKNRLFFSYDSPLIEKINEVYINHLIDESYSYKDEKRKLKYLSDEFTKFFKINNHDFLETKAKIKNIISLCFYKDVKNPKVIVAASGMCDEGRMINLLEKYFTDENATIILTGFQASGTNGFFLKNLLNAKYDDNEKKTIPLKLNRNDFRLVDGKCNIEDMSEYYSGHADQEQLLDYITPDQRNTGNITVLLNHGTDSAREMLKSKIEEKSNNIQVKLPEFNKWLNLSTYEYEADDIELNKNTNVDFSFLEIDGIHIYYPAKYDNEKIQSIIEFIREL